MVEQRKKIFVTGATGFLGSHFLAGESLNNFDCYLLTRDKSIVKTLFGERGWKILEGNVSEISRFSQELSLCDYFIHIAGEKRNESRMEETNVTGLKKILEAIAGFPKLRFMLISSGGVYGIRSQHSHFLSEEIPCLPANAYERSKLKAENVLFEWAEKHPQKYIILRPTNVFGEDDSHPKLLGLMHALRNERFFLIDKHAYVNYVYVKHVTDVMWKLITLDHFDNEVYNVNSPMLLRSFVKYLKSDLGIKKRSRFIPSWIIYPVAFLSDKFLPDKYQFVNLEKYQELVNKKVIPVHKLKKIVSLDEKHALIGGLSNMVAYYQHKKMLW